MRPLYLCLLLCLFCLDGLGQGSQSAPAKQPQHDEEVSQEEIVRVDTTLVGVPVTVLDRDGRYVPNLKQEDFHVYEDGVEQQIAYFAPVEMPVTVLLLFDHDLLARHFIKDMHETALAFTEQLRTGDKVIVAKFGATTYETLTKVTDGRAGVQKEAHRVKWHFATPLHDAVEAAIQHMNGIRGRKAIVLFSDGVLRGIEEVTVAMPTGRLISEHETKPRERATPQRTINEAEESDAPIYVMQYDTMTDTVRYGPKPGTEFWEERDIFARARNDYKLGDEYLHALAEKSGARLYQADKPPGLAQTFTQLSEELRQQYSLGYYPKKGGQPNERRALKVRVQKPDVVVRSRTSYIYAPPKR
jgi:Ca-activated chloride channel homolog